ncbi:ABATE domain-containing protein [Umezawaea sp. Da 62-37]|uniref:CGNR zinc finger domain-containing protein n=1 Tax=Umezawaea sp. Da 62-37 TaxID=3075927 RepID=UPI0028F711BE|nr:ABATE domain-containing protein [Umezawaea sp. Da 62-37]WNV91325.1 CGNR zinc finger domain-containing protein [Umezawaea sp. Da 62-37]
MDFTFVSGNVALDFAGTVGSRRTERIQLLTDPADLTAWITAAGLVDVAPDVDERVFEDALVLREEIYRLACAARDGEDYTGLALLNDRAARPPIAVGLGADGGITRTGDVDAVLTTVSRAAVGLLARPLAAEVRECGADTCTRLYVDNSRRGSRRWCDMKSCGNRVKASQFRARHA